MTGVTIWTWDWVPEGPRGHVRDIRLRWAMEEAGLPYDVRTVAFGDRGPGHLDRQPFGQVPFIDDDGVRVFESGAALLHLAEKSEILMPRDPQGRADTLQWTIAALNSIEMVSVPWWFIGLSGGADNPLDGWLTQRLDRLEPVLAGRDWLAAGRFTVADIMMADALRVPAVRARLDTRPALGAYVDRVCARPAFLKACRDQIAQYEAADRVRDAASG